MHMISCRRHDEHVVFHARLTFFLLDRHVVMSATCLCLLCMRWGVCHVGDMSVSTYLGVSVCQVGVHVGVCVHVGLGLGQVRGMSVSTCTCTWVLGTWETCRCLHTLGFWACGGHVSVYMHMHIHMGLGYVGNMSVSTYFGVLGMWGPCQCLHAHGCGSRVRGKHVRVYILWTFVHMGGLHTRGYRAGVCIHTFITISQGGTLNACVLAWFRERGPVLDAEV